MFKRITRSGGSAYLQLVESYRNEAGSGVSAWWPTSGDWINSPTPTLTR